jgi:hypothetical protein
VRTAGWKSRRGRSFVQSRARGHDAYPAALRS